MALHTPYAYLTPSGAFLFDMINFMNSLINHFDLSQYSVSFAGFEDVETLLQLINHAFDYQDTAKGEKRISKEKLLEKMDQSEFYLWKHEDEIVACCYVEVCGDSLHFGLLCVADRLRGSELAPSIIRSIEEYGSCLHKPVIKLDYMSLSPRLKKYYEGYGYKVTDETRELGWCQLISMEKQI